MKKIMCILIVAAIMLPIIVIPAYATENDKVAYIVNNVGELADVYEQLHPESNQSFMGTYVEFSIPVIVVSTGALGTYLDFDGNNGYMVVANGNDVLKWEVAGDLQYLKPLETTYFSVVDGFGYYSDDYFVPYENVRASTGDTIVNSAYNGQSYSGEGGITNLADYVLDRYTSHHELDGYHWLIGNFWYMEQSDYSIYEVVNSNGTTSGEGNCGLTAIYALLNYLKTSNKCTNFPSSYNTITYYAGNDSFYSKYASNSGYSINSPITLPQLYKVIRDYAIDNYFYETGGLFSGYNASLIEDIAEHYGENVNATIHTLGSFESCVKDQIDDSNPVLFSVDGSETYGSHAMVVTGYRIYAKTTTILGIEFKDYVYFLEVNDNWSSNACYFDYTAFKGTHSFVTVEVD